VVFQLISGSEPACERLMKQGNIEINIEMDNREHQQPESDSGLFF